MTDYRNDFQKGDKARVNRNGHWYVGEVVGVGPKNVRVAITYENGVERVVTEDRRTAEPVESYVYDEPNEPFPGAWV